jgi:hypothetical protein
MKNLIFVLGIIPICLAACAQHYGTIIVAQAKVEVHSEPKGAEYYLISERNLREAVGANTFVRKTQKTPALVEFLKSQVDDTADVSPIIHEAGRYRLVLECGDFYSTTPVQIQEGQTNVFTVACTNN